MPTNRCTVMTNVLTQIPLRNHSAEFWVSVKGNVCVPALFHVSVRSIRVPDRRHVCYLRRVSESDGTHSRRRESVRRYTFPTAVSKYSFLESLRSRSRLSVCKSLLDLPSSSTYSFFQVFIGVLKFQWRVHIYQTLRPL